MKLIPADTGWKAGHTWTGCQFIPGHKDKHPFTPLRSPIELKVFRPCKEAGAAGGKPRRQKRPMRVQTQNLRGLNYSATPHLTDPSHLSVPEMVNCPTV